MLMNANRSQSEMESTSTKVAGVLVGSCVLCLGVAWVRIGRSC